ncbi:head-tail adaptor protein [Lactobacillus mulieris]|uniref:Head-tail adaptor protein n=2 Tax=Lactobacillus mulieris TaxID=2508708 RepID=A0AAW5WWA3_9LACO|nr:head-tail adaptor protein [Lactobacillus mulieris]MCF1847357.1 head-tail adaptor protein [Lactobacillus mulieris]MCW8093530.1 head-tail adaptor protein [Lactobacillus mulieris]MCZ9647140.1 head-tail adaptor protein [Lactobacillus mulieris]MCZ9677590.1 head-tail adaptor protein [Lactobacillus mulieris]MDK6563555.1 head-tail adaptor protein [Lactobacillus mulieris]
MKKINQKTQQGDWKSVMVPVKKLWADVAKSTLKEYREDANLLEGKEKVIFLINSMAAKDITRKNFIQFKDKNYNITDIQRDFETHDFDKFTGVEVDK